MPPAAATSRRDKLNKCLKGFLVVVNSIFLLVGMAIVAGGSYLLASKWADIDPDLMTKVGGGLIGIGLVTMFISCAGCIGAIYKKKCLLVTYIIFVFLIMVVCAGLSYVLFVSDGTLRKIKNGEESGNAEFESLSKELEGHFDSIYCKAQLPDAGDKYSTWTNWIQTSCSAFNTTEVASHCSGGSCKAGEKCAYHYCKTQIASTILDYVTPVAAGIAGFSGLQLLLVVAACCMCCYNKAKTLEEKYDGKGTFVEFY